MMYATGEIEDTRLEAKDKKKSLAKADPLEAKDRNAQGHKRKCPQKNIFFRRSPKKKGFQKKFF